MISQPFPEGTSAAKQSWRLIPLEVNDAFTNMSIDEAILRLRQEGKVPNTIRLYRWKPSAVSIGCFQGIHQEVNLDACRSNNIDVVRRITGGGAVFHSFEGEVTYSLVTPEDNPLVPKNILKSYETLCEGVIQACKILGLQSVEFKPINDVQTDGRKISGNAQTRKNQVVLQHGTVLVSFDAELMFNVLKVSQVKVSDKLIQSVYKRVTSLERELNRPIAHAEVAQAITQGFERALGITLVPGRLTQEELRLAKKIREERFTQESWNFQR